MRTIGMGTRKKREFLNTKSSQLISLMPKVRQKKERTFPPSALVLGMWSTVSTYSSGSVIRWGYCFYVMEYTLWSNNIFLRPSIFSILLFDSNYQQTKIWFVCLLIIRWVSRGLRSCFLGVMNWSHLCYRIQSGPVATAAAAITS